MSKLTSRTTYPELLTGISIFGHILQFKIYAKSSSGIIDYYQCSIDLTKWDEWNVYFLFTEGGQNKTPHSKISKSVVSFCKEFIPIIEKLLIHKCINEHVFLELSKAYSVFYDLDGGELKVTMENDCTGYNIEIYKHKVLDFETLERKKLYITIIDEMISCRSKLDESKTDFFCRGLAEVARLISQYFPDV